MKQPLRIAMVAGESSGDQLAAGLIRELKLRYPNCQIVGVAGPEMHAAGCEIWFDSSELAVMGLAEVLRHLPRIWKLRKQLLAKLEQNPPDLFIGIDAPDFNLGLERILKSRGIPVVHYVSPSVWAWRQSRAKKINQSVDRILTLFPFEPKFYQQHGIDARFVGHPMADDIPLQNDRATALSSLQLEASPRYIALLPGSRKSEVERLGKEMLAAARIIHCKHPDCHFLIPLASQQLYQDFIEVVPKDLPIQCFVGRMREVVAASDVVLTASGTASLETLLIGRPMVVCYKLASLTYAIAKGFKLVKSKYFSLPNILANKMLVPELLQNDANPETMAKEVLEWLNNSQQQQAVQAEFKIIHQQLRQDASKKAVTAITDLLT